MKKINSKGFSLIELIIVIAIMVALIAVMAPNFVKYIQKSHDAVVTAAAEDVLSFIKAEWADGSLNGKGTIRVGAKPVGDKKVISVDFVSDGEYGTNTLTYWTSNDKTDDSSSYAGDNHDIERFRKYCGVDEDKPVKSDLCYYITIDNTISSHPTLEVASTIDPENG